MFKSLSLVGNLFYIKLFTFEEIDCYLDVPPDVNAAGLNILTAHTTSPPLHMLKKVFN